MFTKKVTDDDNFMSLSSSAQALYLHLSMSADDDGFCNQISVSMFKAHASVQDLQALLEKRYIYQFDNGVIVIKHWRMANALRKDRYTPTAFQDELKKLDLKPNGSYTWLPDGCQMVANRLPQDRLEENRLEEDRINNPSFVEDDAESKSENLQKAIDEWLQYKAEKKQTYKPTGKKNLLNKINRTAEEYGEDAVISEIHCAMENNWQGIVWDKFGTKYKPKKKSTESVPKLLTEPEPQDLSDEEWLRMMEQTYGDV